jgi:PPE-repeat protein
MSFLIATPETVSAAATDVAALGSRLGAAHAAAVTATTGVLPAALDEVSVAIAALFGAHGQTYQALGAQALTFQEQFVQLLGSGASMYADAEANAVQALTSGAPGSAQAIGPATVLQSIEAAVGNVNLGSGNIGNLNLGSGLVGIGGLNSSSSNFGLANTGTGDVGLANTGNNNIGFANTGDNNIGIANTGIRNMGLWNTGSNNTGVGWDGNSNTGTMTPLDSGTHNQGFFNSGDRNVGFFNSGNTSTSPVFDPPLAGGHNFGLFNSGGALFTAPGDSHSPPTVQSGHNLGLFNSGFNHWGILNLGVTNTGIISPSYWLTPFDAGYG